MAESGPGSQTSEFKLAKLVAWAGIALTALSVALPHLVALFTDLHAAFPDESWVGKAGAVLTSVATVVYTLSRWLLKSKQIQADATVQIQTSRPVSPP